MPTARATSRPALTLLATGLGLFMIFLDATIVNVALPDIQKDFDVGEQGIQWVVAAYSLTFGMFMMSSASIADGYGRRKAYVGGMILFGAASLACGMAPSADLLNVFRGVQGVGAALVNVASLALVGAAYPDPSAKARAVGLWTGIAAVGIAIGPTLGGLLTEAVSWRWVFLINPIVVIVAVLLTVAFVPESKDPTRHRFDPAGQVLFVVGVASVTYALVEGPHEGWTSPLILSLFAVSLLVLVAFVLTELRVADPMMDVRVFKDGTYSAAIVTVFAVLFAVYGTLLVITQYFQNVRDFSPEKTGVLLLSFSAPAVVLAPLSGRLAARFGGRRPTLVGVGSGVVGAVVLAFFTGDLLWLTVVGLTFVGAAGGLAVAPATSVAMSSIAPERSGMASGILSAQRALGSTAGFAIMGSVLAAVVAATLPGKLESIITDEAARDRVVAAVEDAAAPRAVPNVIGPAGPLPAEIRERAEAVDAADAAFQQGVRVAEGVALAVLVGAFIVGWLVFPRTARAARAEELGEAEELESVEERLRAEPT